MTFDEMASGGLLFAGSVLPTVLRPVLTRFVPGEAVYNVAKARRGMLEKVIVKTVRTVTNKRTLGANRVLYIDTLNGFWNEYDLVRPDEAHALVGAYIQRLCGDAGKLAKC
jgi:hypothetical protein